MSEKWKIKKEEYSGKNVEKKTTIKFVEIKKWESDKYLNYHRQYNKHIIIVQDNLVNT